MVLQTCTVVARLLSIRLHGRPRSAEHTGRLALLLHAKSTTRLRSLHRRLRLEHGLDAALDAGADHALHSRPMAADHLRQHLAGQQRQISGFFLENDLQQDAAREDFAAAYIDHGERFNVADSLAYTFASKTLLITVAQLDGLMDSRRST